ncbi:MAG: nitronate monooxygenase [Spirochaetia bacterium]
MAHPEIIQGGMGVGVSDWRLAREVSIRGGLGVVSGTALDAVFVRRLQQGDQGGHLRRGLAAFPAQDIAQRILDTYYNPEGDESFHDFSQLPLYTQKPDDLLVSLTVAANFVEVFLAKEGHSGEVGINFLEKIQMPNPASVYGAMLAGVDYILVGAGIPVEFPAMLDRFAAGQAAELKLHVEGAQKGELYTISFDPSALFHGNATELKRPKFLAIVSSFILAATMAKKVEGVDGLVLENHTAGGHNAPPRGKLQLNDRGEPVFGPKDEIDYKKISSLGLPFWIAGGYSMPGSLQAAKAEGAKGIQVGSVFAFCKESGILSSLKQQFLKAVEAGKNLVFTDPFASPTGFPFKLALVEKTLSNAAEYLERKRICNLGYLRKIYKKDDGTLGYRCPAEPVDSFISKGGAEEEVQGRKCLCNALLANIGLAKEYVRGYMEKPLLTVGECIDSIKLMIARKGREYAAADVMSMLTDS